MNITTYGGIQVVERISWSLNQQLGVRSYNQEALEGD